MATVAIATVAIMASPVLSKVKFSKIRDILGGRSNNREVLGVKRRLLDDSEARENLRVTFIFLLLLFRNIICRGRLILIDDVTVYYSLVLSHYSHGFESISYSLN